MIVVTIKELGESVISVEVFVIDVNKVMVVSVVLNLVVVKSAVVSALVDLVVKPMVVI